MINSYLRELVQNNRRVIIPDFGAFLKKDKNAATSEDFVTFSPFLRFNDGLLEGYLVEKKRITKEEASAAVRQYVQDIKQTIAEQRPYYVEELGAFYEDERGSVQFLYAETEKEALKKFEEAVAAARLNTPTFMPEMEVKTPVAVEEIVKPVAEEKKKMIKKKVVEVVPEEEEDDVVEAEEVKTVSVRGRKKVDAATKKEAKDNNAVAKTIINVNVNTDKSKEESVRAEEKSKQLEVANSSLERWKEEVEKRRGEQVQDAPMSQEEAEAKRRRREEVERALEKKRRDDEEARDKHQSQPAVWEEEVVERKRGGRGAVLLLLLMLIVISVAGALWFWTPISEALGWESEYGTSIDFYDAPVSAQQPNTYYVVVGSFSPQQMKAMEAVCQLLHNEGYTPEIIVTGSDKSPVSIGKYRSAAEAKIALDIYTKKYGTTFGTASVLP